MATPRNTIALFNHGGGLRGLVPAHIMTRIEDTTGLRMVDMVDIFTGPSTGAILNAGLNVPHPREPGRPRFRARHMVRFYEREGHKIFPPDRFREFRAFIHDFNNRTMKIGQLNKLFRHGHYSPEHLSRSLKAMYGDNRLCDSLRSLVIPVYNIDGEQLRIASENDEGPDAPAPTKNNFRDDGGHAVWLKNIKNLKKNGCTADVMLHDAVLASTAAPSYFPCHHFEATLHGTPYRRAYSGIDGSIFDNACISYHGAVRHHVPEGNDLKMIVLGTGYTLRSFKKEEWNRFGGLGIVDPVNDLPLINILFHASESALLESFTEELEDGLFILNKRLSEGYNAPSSQIDDASPENFKRLQIFAEEIMEENKTMLDNLCHTLVQNRDARQQEQKEQGLLDKLRFFFAPRH